MVHVASEHILTVATFVSPKSNHAADQAKGVTVKVDTIRSLNDVGKMLLEDIGDLQYQYDSYLKQNNLKAYEAIFNLLYGLYECYADVLGLFAEACAKITTHESENDPVRSKWAWTKGGA